MNINDRIILSSILLLCVTFGTLGIMAERRENEHTYQRVVVEAREDVQFRQHVREVEAEIQHTIDDLHRDIEQSRYTLPCSHCKILIDRPRKH